MALLGFYFMFLSFFFAYTGQEPNSLATAVIGSVCFMSRMAVNELKKHIDSKLENK